MENGRSAESMSEIKHLHDVSHGVDRLMQPPRTHLGFFWTGFN